MSAPGATFVVVATYNERENVEPLLQGLRAALPDAEVVVVDDHSPDGTGEVLDELREHDRLLHVIHRDDELGYASAQIAGMLYALAHGAGILVSMDADLSHDPAYLPDIVALLRDSDVVIGSRYVPGGVVRNSPWRRRFLSRCANVISRTLLGLPAADCSSGFRGYRAALLRRAELGSCKARGYGLLEELLFRCRALGARVTELPIVFVDRRHGRSKLSGAIALEALATVLRLFWERVLRRVRTM
jgi:dolichol-phosphate mannosyltransferase